VWKRVHNRFRGGLEFKAHGLVYHSTPGLRIIQKKKKKKKTPRSLSVRSQLIDEFFFCFCITLKPRVE
jgi:hypothetical protein